MNTEILTFPLVESPRNGHSWEGKKERGVFPKSAAQAPLGRSDSIHLAGLVKHSILYLLGLLKKAEWRFITTDVHSSPSSLAAAGALLLTSHIPAEAEAHDNFSFETSRCLVRKEIHGPKELGRQALGLGRQPTERPHLPAPTNLSPP